MTTLVTGAAGFIGSHLCDRILALDGEVVGFDSFDDFYPRSVKERNLRNAHGQERFTFIEGDVRDPDALQRLPDSIDSVVHLAARTAVRPSIANAELYADVNVMGTACLLSWARERGIGSFIFASSSSVYGNNDKVPFAESDSVDHPISPYAATKRSAELLCHTASHLDGIVVASLRLFTVYGPRQRPDLAIHKFARLLRNGDEIPMFGDGSTSRDYTYVSDTIAGILAALEWARSRDRGVEIFNLGNHKTVPLREMIATLAEEMSVEARVQELPVQPGDVRRTYADISKASEILAYRPSTDFRTGIRHFLEWFATEPA